MIPVDLTGQVFGRLTVKAQAGVTGGARKRATWACQCSCGTWRTFAGRSLRRGDATSCGCGSQNRWWTGPGRVNVRRDAEGASA